MVTINRGTYGGKVVIIVGVVDIEIWDKRDECDDND